MAGSVELLRTWVHETLGQLADDDDQHARLRDTLRVFLGGDCSQLDRCGRAC
jgi:DNA-binding PucR family transcriptional regulator